MKVDLSEKDLTALRNLCERDWNLWDRCREQAPSHKEYVYAHLKQMELDGLLARLGGVC